MTEIFSQWNISYVVDKFIQIMWDKNILLHIWLFCLVLTLWKYFSHQNLYKDHEFFNEFFSGEKVVEGGLGGCPTFFPGGKISMKLRVDIWKAYGGELWMRGVQQHIFYFLKPNSSVRILSSNICRSCMSRTVLISMFMWIRTLNAICKKNNLLLSCIWIKVPKTESV